MLPKRPNELLLTPSDDYRRKKCDETKPICTRCTEGGFLCQGYIRLPTAPYRVGLGDVEDAASQLLSVAQPPRNEEKGLIATSSFSHVGFSYLTGVLVAILIIIKNVAWPIASQQNIVNLLAFERGNSPPQLIISRGIPLDPAAFSDMIPVIVTQCKLFLIQ